MSYLTILLGMAVMAWLAVFTDLWMSCLAADTWDHGNHSSCLVNYGNMQLTARSTTFCLSASQPGERNINTWNLQIFSFLLWCFSYLVIQAWKVIASNAQNLERSTMLKRSVEVMIVMMKKFIFGHL